MHHNVLVLLLCSVALVLVGCKKHETPRPVPKSQAQTDVCTLLTKKEIEAIQGSPIKETKSSAHSDAGFLVSQCFYTAAEFSKSCEPGLMQRDPGRPTTTSPKDFWKERFGRYSGDEKEGDKIKAEIERKEGKEESVAPKNIDGIGEEAFWVRLIQKFA